MAKRFQKAKQQKSEKEKLEAQGKDSNHIEIRDIQETDQRKLVTPGAIFGDLSLILQKRGRHLNIYALEESTLLMFSNYQISRIIKVW